MGKAQQIIGGNIKEAAQGFQVIHTGFVFVVFHIGDFALRHIHGLTQFSLAQLKAFSKKADFFAESQFHTYHRI